MGEYKTDINTHKGREDRLGGNKKDINVSSRCVSCYGSLTPAGRVKSLWDQPVTTPVLKSPVTTSNQPPLASEQNQPPQLQI